MTKNLSLQPLLIDFGILVLGLVVFFLPKLGVLNGWLGLGQGVGSLIGLGALYDSFRILFVDKDWVDESARLANLTALRILWAASAALAIYCSSFL